MSSHGYANLQYSIETMENQRPTKNELDKKFVIEEMYGTIGAYPSGIGATLVLAKVFNTYIPKTQVPSSLESFPSPSQSLEEIFSKVSLQDSPCSSTFSPPVFTGESPCTRPFTSTFRNDRYSHAELLFLRQLELEVQQLQQGGNKVTKINAELIQNYAPCHECADAMITFKETMEKEGKEVSIKVIFANYYYWIGRHRTDMKGWNNLLKLKEMHDKGIDLQLLQGKESWETLFGDSHLVNLQDEEKEELLQKATSEKRQRREEYDRTLRHEKNLF